MKVGVLTEIINGHSGARAPLEIGVQLKKLGHDVTVYAYDFWQDKSMVEYLLLNHVKVLKFSKPQLGKYFVIPKLFFQLKKDNPHILYFSGTPPFFITGWLTRIPIVRMYQGTQFDAYLEYFIPNQPLPFYENFINRLANIFIYLIDFMSFRLSVAIVAISKYAADEGESLYHRKVSQVIYHGISPLIRSRIKPRQSKSISLISVSRITPYKGFHLIINALKKIKIRKKLILTIAGSQPKPHYIEYLKQIGGQMVRIIVDPTDTELAKLYNQADIYVTCDRYLYFGLPIGEAAQFGLPAVALNLAAADEIIKHGKTGYVAKNHHEFGYYLEKLISNSQLRQKLGANAQVWMKNFSWERCGRAWEKVLLKYSKSLSFPRKRESHLV